MGGCAIRNCKNRAVKDGGIRYFAFPKNESLAQEWLRYCGPKATVRCSRVCSVHFTSSDYTKSLQNILLNLSPVRVRTLKPDAVPTLHIGDGDKDKRSTRMLIKPSETISRKIARPGNVTGKGINVKCGSECDTVSPNEMLEEDEIRY